MPAYKYEVWDVFAATRFQGNPLAVVSGADALSSEEMQAAAREFNLSETVFVLAARKAGHTARIRIFTPGYEMPFAGHPTVGAAIAIATARNLEGDLVLELKAGDFPVRVERSGRAPFARFENPNPPTVSESSPSAEKIEAALRLPKDSVERGARAPRRVGAGTDFVYARTSLDAVRNARLDSAAFADMDLAGAVGVFLYAEGGDSADADWHARMFAPGAGVPEDPATGSAVCALPGHVALSENFAGGSYRWIIEQGVEMGRPSRIEVDFEVVDGAVATVGVGGTAVPVARGRIEI